MVNNIKGNTISEVDAKKYLNTLNIIKNLKIKHRRLIPEQKELLNLFGDLSNIILTDKISENQEDKNEEKENKKLKEENENENENENEDDNENENENKNEDDYYDYEYEDDKTIDQNEIIKEKNDYFDKMIDKSKSVEDQIKSLKKVENLDDYYYDDDFDDK